MSGLIDVMYLSKKDIELTYQEYLKRRKEDYTE